VATAIVPASITLSWRPIVRPMTAFRAPDDSSEKDERNDMIDAIEPPEATARTEQMDPAEATDAMDPTEPMDRIDPRDAIERIDSSDHKDHRDRDAIGLSPRGGAAQPLPLSHGDENQAP
jgi:hypothetical protein